MAEKETVILDFQVNQGDAISELEKTKKSIIQLKQEQAELNKAYKAGNVTLEEFASESVRLEGILKKQQSTYNNVQKSVTGVKTQLDKLIDSNKKISASFQEAANNINVAGVNVGQLGNQLKSLTGPAGVLTGAVAVVTALGAAYARSTVGAKDLEFAQNQLGIATGLLANKFSELVNTSNEDGEGFLSQVVFSLLFRIDSGLAVQSKVLALIQEQVEDLERAEIAARSIVADRLADNQELLTQIQDSQTDYNEKIHLTGQIISNISKNEDELLAIKKQQLAFVERQLANDTENEDKQRAVLEVQREISNIQKDAERRRQAVLRLESNITDQYNKQLEAQKKARQDQEEERRKTLRSDVEKRGAGGRSISDLAGDTVRLDARAAAQRVRMAEKTEEQVRDEYRESYALYVQLQNEKLGYTAMILAQSTALISEQSALGKVLGIAQATIDTYRGANLALATLPPPFGQISAALTIATGLANVAKITGVAAAGGADFTTKGPTMLIVGDNPGGVEHVSVKPISGKGKTRVWPGGIAAAGGVNFNAQGIDGGAAKNQAVSEVNGQLMVMNAIKNMPAPVVSWVEGERVGKRVRWKQNISKMRGR